MDSLEHHNILFVYGSLRRGRERGHFLSAEKTKFLCPATAKGVLYAIGDFPGLVLNSPTQNHSAPTFFSLPPAPPDNHDAQVQGELFEIFDPVTFFATLDVIEGFWPEQAERSLFVRRLIAVETEKGEMKAWAYVLNLPLSGLARFDSGEQ